MQGNLPGSSRALSWGTRCWTAPVWIWITVTLLVAPAMAVVPRESQIKAAFLYNFTKFVEWSPEHFEDDASPLVIGVLGRNTTTEVLEEIVVGRGVNSRELLVRSVETEEDAHSVHILFVPEGTENQFLLLRDGLTSAGVLTCGESERFTSLGGIISFVTEGDRVRFAINVRSADRSGLKLSAQLLKLAVNLRR